MQPKMAFNSCQPSCLSLSTAVISSIFRAVWLRGQHPSSCLRAALWGMGTLRCPVTIHEDRNRRKVPLLTSTQYLGEFVLQKYLYACMWHTELSIALFFIITRDQKILSSSSVEAEVVPYIHMLKHYVVIKKGRLSASGNFQDALVIKGSTFRTKIIQHPISFLIRENIVCQFLFYIKHTNKK